MRPHNRLIGSIIGQLSAHQGHLMRFAHEQLDLALWLGEPFPRDPWTAIQRYSHILVCLAFEHSVSVTGAVILLHGASHYGSDAGQVWRPPPGKRGVFLFDRLVAVGSRGIRVRGLGANRAGEIKITRFSRNKAVRIGEMIETAAARLDACCRAPCACHPGHNNGSRRREWALHCFASRDRGRCDRRCVFGTCRWALLHAERRQGCAAQG